MWSSESFSTESFSTESWDFGESEGGQGFSGGGRPFTGWDGKIYSSPEMAPPRPRKRIYFDESQARAIVQAENVIESIQIGGETKETLFAQAEEVISDIRAEIVKIDAASVELQREEKIREMQAKIEEIDAAFMLFAIVTLH